MIKQDKAAAGTSLYVAIAVLSCLRTAFYPFLPFSAQKLHGYLGYSHNVQLTGWKFVLPPAGQLLLAPQPLFSKLDEKLVDEENQRLEHSQAE
jgi:methionyl-tRNA synthetase